MKVCWKKTIRLTLTCHNSKIKEIEMTVTANQRMMRKNHWLKMIMQNRWISISRKILTQVQKRSKQG